MPINSFADYLLAHKFLPQAALQTAETQAQKTGIPLTSVLMRQQDINYQQLATYIGEYFGLELIDLQQLDLTELPLDCIGKEVISKYKILPIKQEQNELSVAIADPSQLKVLDEIEFHTGLQPRLMIAAFDKLHDCIEQIIHSASSQKTNDITVIKFLDQLLRDAVHKEASDVHFEPYPEQYRIRFRIDGMLHEFADPPLNLVERITARLKIMAHLDIAEKRLPQDGRFSINIEQQQNRDCRISTCPTVFGEKVVVRILNPQHAAMRIDTLGLDQQQLQFFQQASQKPQGMILVTGPTGSGKTMSLYAALQEINVITKNIITVEDPVEIEMPGITQVHVNPKINLNFATALRAFLRQDPDIIMVGEIRDLETAEIAVRAAQTGHLVLSTLHTNSAAETITRLLNMGVASFNLGSVLKLIIAQRLVRKLCPHCKQREIISEKILLEQGFLKSEVAELNIYSAQGCDKCHDGYKGRVGVFEVMPISETMSQLIMEQHNSAAIRQQAEREGTMNLRAAALDKVRQGVTSLAEINRVI